MPGTPAARAASRPYTPGLGLWVCTMSGRRRRNSRVSSNRAARSCPGDTERVAWRSGTCSIPHSVSCETNGPGADTPITSIPSAAKTRSCGPSKRARLMSAVVRWINRRPPRSVIGGHRRRHGRSPRSAAGRGHVEHGAPQLGRRPSSARRSGHPTDRTRASNQEAGITGGYDRSVDSVGDDLGTPPTDVATMAAPTLVASRLTGKPSCGRPVRRGRQQSEDVARRSVDQNCSDLPSRLAPAFPELVLQWNASHGGEPEGEAAVGGQTGHFQKTS